MCGIVGVISNSTLGKPEQKFITQGLYVDLLRGKDSTGIAVIKKNSEVVTIKEALPSYHFLGLDRVGTEINKFNSNVAIIGHNRSATRGSVDHSNSHPFTHGNITMVHNGTLTYTHNLDNHNDFDTDSEAICFNINKNGVEDTIKKCEGAFALVWHDKSDDTISMVRNTERTLYVAKATKGTSDDTECVLFASEQGMLTWLASRTGLVVKEVLDVTVGHLLTFDLKAKDVFEYTCDKIELKPKKVYPMSNYGGSYNNGYGHVSSWDKERDQKLAKAGYEYDEDLLVTFTDFDVRNKHNNYGIAEGTEYDGTTKVMSYVLGKNIYEKGGVYIGKVSSINNLLHKGVQCERIVLKDVTRATAGDIAFHEELFADEKDEEKVDQRMLIGPNKKLIPYSEWVELVADNCCMCNDYIFPKDHKEIQYTTGNDPKPVCPKCIEGYIEMNYGELN